MKYIKKIFILIGYEKCIFRVTQCKNEVISVAKMLQTKHSDWSMIKVESQRRSLDDSIFGVVSVRSFCLTRISYLEFSYVLLLLLLK